MDVGCGDGAVDAIFNAIEKLINSETKLQLYSVNAVTEGTDSQGEVTVRLEKEGRIINGQGADTDILLASAKAYVNALTLMRKHLCPRNFRLVIIGDLASCME